LIKTLLFIRTIRRLCGLAVVPVPGALGPVDLLVGREREREREKEKGMWSIYLKGSKKKKRLARKERRRTIFYLSGQKFNERD